MHINTHMHTHTKITTNGVVICLHHPEKNITHLVEGKLFENVKLWYNSVTDRKFLERYRIP